MSQSKLNKILKELSQEIVKEISRDVKDEMRAYLWGELRIAIKDVLKKEEISLNSQAGYLSMEQIQKKYHISKTSICKKCRKYKVQRLSSGKYKLINEFQFIESLKQKEDFPLFISQGKNNSTK